MRFPLSVHCLPLDATVRELPDHPLASIDFGLPPLKGPEAGVQIAVPLSRLGPTSRRIVWSVDEPPELLREGRIRLAVSSRVAFGAIEASAGEGTELEATTRSLYGEILRVLRDLELHPLRFWNVLPGINEEDDGMERYRWFCRGRGDAFRELLGEGFEERLCAASAVGSDGDSLLVYFLAGPEPGEQVENPRQVSAYAYPRRYGPRSPSFARATRAPGSLGGQLLLSGTASVVGHGTLHRESVEGQLEETLRNLDCVAATGGYGRGDLRALKVFVRHAGDLPAIRERLEAELPPELPVLYLRADICREDLLLEIEGVLDPRKSA